MSEELDIVDWAHFERSRKELGPGFIRILSYFREDGAKSVAQIEMAMREQNTASLVLPAHTLKGEARQLGAEPLAAIAELIESTARFCIETHSFPDELISDVVELRKVFERTVELFEKATNPLVSAHPPGRASAARPATRNSAGSRRRRSRPPLRRACASAGACRATGSATAIRAGRS